ncbi:MAG TPA: chitobiase/beta-hexosaminidase C-terminal domain-containing protein, partial [Planctomycetota bacterium]|nr:chitobiase/beta-hexosaminidase C-terminal domain-containing protein [Planctomycetota bacterium]
MIRRNRSHACIVAPRALTVLFVAAASASLEAQVVINEVLASNSSTRLDDDGDSSDWVELHNVGPEAVDLKDYSLSDDRFEPQKWMFPSTSLGPGAYLIVWCSDKDRTDVPAERLTEPNSALPFDADLIPPDAEWAYLTGGPADPGPPADWKSPGLDDSTWPRGRPGFGFGNDTGIRTPLPAGIGPVFLRRTFDFQPEQRNIVLQVRYDDGFVAYLNGIRVASGNFPEGEEPSFASRATRGHSATTVERFDLTARMDLLEAGENVLAIAVLNQIPTNNDLILFPALGNVPAPLHTSFKISADGGPVLLVDPAGRIHDEVDLPLQSPDHSYARSPDGSGPFLYHRTPTPGARNEGPASDRPLLVADTKFSSDRGFYDAPFEVALTTETEGAQIRYTLDGSAPEETSGIAYMGPILMDRTTTLRARAFKPGFEPTNTDTHTYIFLDDIVEQDSQAVLAAGFPRTWGSTPADYGLDPDVVGPNDRFGGIYAATIRDDLRSLPTLSIVLSMEDMFGARGIYTNSEMRGAAWERPASVEWISSDGGSEFQVDCGIRIQGGYFRAHGATRKHSLRLLFRGRYGAAKLKHPLFGDDAVDEFDTLTLRAGANDGYSWNAARLTEQYTRDELGRVLQRATGNAGSHGIFAHLYINGVYWGLYNPAERPDHAFSSSYYGGDKDDWDAIHDGAATAGTSAAWNEMLGKTQEARTLLAPYMELQGRDLEGSRDPNLPHLLDVPNYADYLVVNLWGGNWDWPWKNWWAGRDRSDRSTGFKFYCWDYENTIGNNRDRSPLTKNALLNDFSSAGQPHQNLRTNPEYRLLFADRVHRLFFNDGVLAPRPLAARYEALAAGVERAIVCESARWGDQHFNPPLTLKEWRTERDWVLGTYLPQRSDIVLQQFRSAALYPAVDAPILSRNGGLVPRGFKVIAGAPDGVVYYSTDGSDPRLPGGATSPSALAADLGTRVVLLPEETDVRWHVPPDAGLGLGWTAVDFDDSAWREGRTAVGFEMESGYEGLFGTDVGEAMHQVNASIYLRCAFEAEDPSALVFLTLRM